MVEGPEGEESVTKQLPPGAHVWALASADRQVMERHFETGERALL